MVGGRFLGAKELELASENSCSIHTIIRGKMQLDSLQPPVRINGSSEESKLTTANKGI